MERGPIFVAGPERSGTSLLYALLASHSQLAMTRRTNLWKHFYEQYGDLADPVNLDRCLDVMARYKRLQVLHVDFRALRRDFVAGPSSYPRLFALLEEQYAGAPGATSLGRQVAAHGVLDRTDPGLVPGRADPAHDARSAGIATRRHTAVEATGWNRCRRRRMAVLGADCGRQRRAVPGSVPRRAVRRSGCRSRDNGAGDLPVRRRAVRTAMLAMGGAPRLLDQGSNSSYGRREAGVIATDSIGRYRSVLSEREIAFAQQSASDEMLELGYPFDDVPMGPVGRARYNLTTVPLERARGGIWTTVEAWRSRRGRPVPDRRLVDAVR